MAVNPIGPVAGNQVTTRPARSNAYGTVRTWHKPCSAPGVQDGTVIDADMFNDWLAQLRTAFDSSGITEDNADDMLWRAIQSAGARYAVDTGSANNIIVACSPPILSLLPGQVIYVKVAAANVAGINSGAVTITADAQSPKAVQFAAGSPLIEGALEAGRVERLVFDGVAFRLERVRARGFYGLATGIPISPATFTAVSPSTKDANSYLSTSTFLNGVFTCGAGEAGWWIFGLNSAFFPGGVPLGSQDAFVSYINGPHTVAQQNNIQYVGNQGNACSVILIEKVGVGDTVNFQCFHQQSSGSFNAYFHGARIGA